MHDGHRVGDFDPPLSAMNTSTSEMALMQLAIAGCTGLNGAATPVTGTGAAELPLASNNCSALTAPLTTPTSLAISWSPKTLGATEVTFPSFSTLLNQHLTFSLGSAIRASLVSDNTSSALAQCQNSQLASLPLKSGSLTTPLTIPPVTAPAMPTGITSVPGNGQITVSWNAANSSLAVTQYRATAQPGGEFCTTTSTSCTITGLTNGVAYTTRVSATNDVGSGPDARSSPSVTPA